MCSYSQCLFLATGHLKRFMKGIAEMADIMKNPPSLPSSFYNLQPLDVNGSAAGLDEAPLPPPNQLEKERSPGVIPPPEEFALSEQKPTRPPMEEAPLLRQESASLSACVQQERVKSQLAVAMGSRESLESEEEMRGRKLDSRSPSGSPQVTTAYHT